MLQRSGIADSKLHGGFAPGWLLKRMHILADAIFQVLVEEYGPHECIRRLADPLWFHCLSNTLGFDWDSSGATTVTTAVLHHVINHRRHGFAIAGGKGANSRKTPDELTHITDLFDLGPEVGDQLIYTSRVTAKIDNNAIQDGYQLYHHVFIVDISGNWAVIQQGMNPIQRKARRYHWLSDSLKSFVEQPHAGFFSSQTHDQVLNLTDTISHDTRKTITDLVKEPLQTLKRSYYSIQPYSQTTLEHWGSNSPIQVPIRYYNLFPKRMNWESIRPLYDLQPDNFEQVIAMKGIGPGTVRALALIAELVYGDAPSWNDPVKYSFTVGGKDGVPYPVNTERMESIAAHLRSLVTQAKLGEKKRMFAFRQLSKIASKIPKHAELS